jgi:hypothetical protein
LVDRGNPIVTVSALPYRVIAVLNTPPCYTGWL